jgi:hypothetical protein
MTLRQRYALVGAIGGAALGATSMIFPSYIKPGLTLGTPMTIFVSLGLAILGAVFGVMTANAR